jgi:hypothetical protein
MTSLIRSFSACLPRDQAIDGFAQAMEKRSGSNDLADSIIRSMPAERDQAIDGFAQDTEKGSDKSVAAWRSIIHSMPAKRSSDRWLRTRHGERI